MSLVPLSLSDFYYLAIKQGKMWSGRVRRFAWWGRWQLAVCVCVCAIGRPNNNNNNINPARVCVRVGGTWWCSLCVIVWRGSSLTMSNSLESRYVPSTKTIYWLWRTENAYLLCFYQAYTCPYFDGQGGPPSFSKLDFAVAWFIRESMAVQIFLSALWDPTISWRTGRYRLRCGGTAEEILDV